MEDNSNYPTREYLQGKVAELEAEIGVKNAALQTQRDAHKRTQDKYNALREVVKSLIEDETIDNIELIAEMNRDFNLGLTRTVSVSICATFDLEIDLEYGEEVDSDSFSFDVQYQYSEVNSAEYSVTDVYEN